MFLKSWILSRFYGGDSSPRQSHDECLSIKFSQSQETEGSEETNQNEKQKSCRYRVRLANAGKYESGGKRGKTWYERQAREKMKWVTSARNTNQGVRAGKRVQAWGNFQTDTVVWWWARKLWFKLMCFFAFRKKFHSYSLEQRNASLMHEWCWTTICRILRYIYIYIKCTPRILKPRLQYEQQSIPSCSTETTR